MRKVPSPRYVPARLALSAVTRPGSPVRAVIIAFGLGLSVLVAVALSQANLVARLTCASPRSASLVLHRHSTPTDRRIPADCYGNSLTEITQTPMLRGRVTKIGGRPASDFDPQNGAAWVLRGDRALTWAETRPAKLRYSLVNGGRGLSGTAPISMAHEEALELGVWLGDTVSFNVLGRKFDATITSIRDVEWRVFR